MSKIGTLSNVMPTATPSEAEIEAWQTLPRDEQLRRLRLELDHQDCRRITSASMSDIRRQGQALADKLRNA